jgi:catechol 2,3-dioxygenase-like lactoylglutathione lyase family enzyme
MIPVKDVERAQRFYTDVLGFRNADGFEGLPPVLRTENGDLMMIYQPNQPETPSHTLATIMVDDVEQTVNELRGKNVQFDQIEIPDMGKTDDKGVMKLPNGRKAAWFKDSEGNTLGLGD